MHYRKLLAAALTVLLAATATVQADDNPRGTIAKVVDAKKIVIMNDLASTPWQFRDASGNAAGFAIDLDRMIASTLDVDLELVPAEWASLIPGLLSNKADIVATTMSATFPRETQILFADPWFQTGIAVIVKPENAQGSWEDLNKAGKKIAVKEGTDSVPLANSLFPNADITSYQNDVDLYQVLKAGRVDAVLNDDASFLAIRDQYGFDTMKKPRELLSNETYAFAVRPGDDFTWQYLNFFLQKIKADGELDALNKYWVEGNQWRADFVQANKGVSQERLDLVKMLGIQDYVPETKGTRMSVD